MQNDELIDKNSSEEGKKFNIEDAKGSYTNGENSKPLYL